jgi:hypothetical protein
MGKKTQLAFYSCLFVFLLVAIAYLVSLGSGPPASNEKYCGFDDDCACGVHVKTGECFYGNRNFVDASKQCPDFCNGIAANLEIKCVENECVQRRA